MGSKSTLDLARATVFRQNLYVTITLESLYLSHVSRRGLGDYEFPATHLYVRLNEVATCMLKLFSTGDPLEVCARVRARLRAHAHACMYVRS